MDDAERIQTLLQIIRKAQITPKLQQVLEEAIIAIKNHDYALAAELIGVKSIMNWQQRQGPYGEYGSHNKEVLGDRVYSILDSMHSELASESGTSRAGTIWVSPEGVTLRTIPKSQNRALEEMRLWDEQSHKRRMAQHAREAKYDLR